MQIPLYGDWLISIRLNKGRNGSCLNPHILLCKRQKTGWGVRFPPSWPVWNWDWSLRKTLKRYQDRLARDLERRAIVKLLHIGIGHRFRLLTLFKLSDGTLRLYYRPPFSVTRCKEWKRST